MKKSLIILTSVLLFITVNIQAVSAVGIDTVVKAVGGKAVVRGIAESAGMMLSPKQLDNYVSVIEKKSFDGDPKAIDFLNKANNVIDMPSAEPATKTGFKKYVLEPAVWLTGLDLVFDAVDAFQDGYDNTSNVPIYVDQCKPAGVPSLDDGQYPYWVHWSSSSGSQFMIGFTNPNHELVNNGTSFYIIESGPYIQHYKSSTSQTWNAPTVSDGSYASTPTGVVGLSYSKDEKPCDYLPKSDDLTVISNDVITTKNHFDNDTYDTNTTYNLEIEMPDNVENNYNYDNDLTVWNMPDPELEVEVSGIDPPDIIDPNDPNDDVIGAVLVKGDPIETPSNFFTLMGDMGAKLHDTYNGVVKFFSDSVSGMEKIMVGSAGLVAFMTGFFDIFPTEVTTVITVGFMMGFIMYFFRR